MELELITEEGALKKIQQISHRKKIHYAVAFWGTGSVENLKIEDTAGGKIICNIQSGCCNPDEIKKLMGIKGIEVRTDAKLHAKVYSSSDGALLGSSNASTNGLAMDGQLAKGWKEANLLVRDKQTLAEIHEWFEARWSELEGQKITAEMLKDATKKWQIQKRISVLRSHSEENEMSLLKSALMAPNEYQGVPIYIRIFTEDLSKGAKEAIKKCEKETPGDARKNHFMPFEEWPLKPNSWYITFFLKGKKGTFENISTTTERVIEIPYKDKKEPGTIYFASKIRNVISAGGIKLKFSSKDKEILKKYTKLLWDHSATIEDDPTRELDLKEAAQILRKIEDVKKEYSLK